MSSPASGASAPNHRSPSATPKPGHYLNRHGVEYPLGPDGKPDRPEVVAVGETSEIATKWRKGDIISDSSGSILSFIEEELEGEKWRVLPAV